MTKQHYFIIILLSFSLLAARCKDAVQSPIYLGTEGTGLENLGLAGNTTIRTNLLYQNPNKFGISIKETDLKIYVEDIYVADAEQPTEIKVAANSKFSFPIVAKFSAMKLMKNALGMLGKKQFNYRIEGTAKIGKAGVFIKVPVKVADVYTVK
jgi:LEA14-like dessication related protein